MVIVVMGVSGAGKSTVGRRLARRLGWPFFEGDDYHPSANVAKMSGGEPLTEDDRRPWLEALARLVAAINESGAGAVLACSALSHLSRERLRSRSQEVVFVHLRGSIELLRERLAARAEHFFPSDLLESQYAALQAPEDALTVDVAQPPDDIVRRIVAELALG